MDAESCAPEPADRFMLLTTKIRVCCVRPVKKLSICGYVPVTDKASPKVAGPDVAVPDAEPIATLGEIDDITTPDDEATFVRSSITAG
jgi:hypothetical protein